MNQDVQNGEKFRGQKGEGDNRTGKDSDKVGLTSVRTFQTASIASTERLEDNW